MCLSFAHTDGCHNRSATGKHLHACAVRGGVKGIEAHGFSSRLCSELPEKTWLMGVISSSISPLEKVGAGGCRWGMVGCPGFENLEWDQLATTLMFVGHFAENWQVF